MTPSESPAPAGAARWAAPASPLVPLMLPPPLPLLMPLTAAAERLLLLLLLLLPGGHASAAARKREAATCGCDCLKRESLERKTNPASPPPNTHIPSCTARADDHALCTGPRGQSGHRPCTREWQSAGVSRSACSGTALPPPSPPPTPPGSGGAAWLSSDGSSGRSARLKAVRKARRLCALAATNSYRRPTTCPPVRALASRSAAKAVCPGRGAGRAAVGERRPCGLSAPGRCALLPAVAAHCMHAHGGGPHRVAQCGVGGDQAARVRVSGGGSAGCLASG